MTGRDPRLPWLVRVTPKRSLFWSGLYSLIAVNVPLFGALYLIGIPRGTGTLVLGLQLVVLAVTAIVWVRYESVFIGVTEREVVERGFAGRVIRSPREQVAAALLAETYRTNAPDTVPQLLLSSSDGRRLLRMRGTFWHEADMQKVAELAAPALAHYPDPITRAEFFQSYPQGEYWFDNRRWLLITGIVLSGIASMTAVLALMSLAGIPFVSS